MCAQFIPIAETLAASGLRVPTLDVLRPDGHLFEILAIQPSGSISLGADPNAPDFVGHANRALGMAKFKAFLSQALVYNSSVALSPEYSCPWDVIREHIAADRIPASGHIWILGCEAITPNDLKQTIAAHPQAQWICEPIPEGPKRFLNVLAYLTRTTTVAGAERTVIVLQFKHKPMAGTTFERDNLILGDVVHIWHNPVDQLRLISLVCSDALEFDPAGVHPCDFGMRPYFIFHPQLNRNPIHVDFSRYRGGLFNRNNPCLEVLTLNWARNFSIPGMDASAYGGSTLYTKAPQNRHEEQRIDHNHRHGLHLNFWTSRRTQLYIFNFDEHVFRLRAPKVFQDVLAVEAARTGPEMLGLLRWRAEDQSWTDSSGDDGFGSLSQGIDPDCEYFANDPYTALDRERLLLLSSGQARATASGAGWHQPINLLSFEAEADERTKRLTFTHEVTPASIDFRNHILGRYVELQRAILPNPHNLPENIREFAGDLSLTPPAANSAYRFNLARTSTGAAVATGIFLGTVAKSDALSVCNGIQKMWGSRDRSRRLVVWYRLPDGRILSITPPIPSIDDDEESPVSFTKGSNS